MPEPWTGERLKVIRQRLKLSQRELGYLLGYHKSSICRWEQRPRISARVSRNLDSLLVSQSARS